MVYAAIGEHIEVKKISDVEGRGGGGEGGSVHGIWGERMELIEHCC